MPKVLDIIELGNPILRKKARTIVDFKDPKLHELCADMIETLKVAHGVGLAAPQVGADVRLFIVWPGPKDKIETPEDGPLVIINPKFTDISKKREKDWEGCLSIPGIRGRVQRHYAIQIDFMNLEGEPMAVEAEDFVARIFQHEYDHLEGIVFLDRIKDTTEIITEREYIKLMKAEDRKNRELEKES